MEEAREWVFCIAYFLQETAIVIKPPPVQAKPLTPPVVDVDDAAEVEDWSFKEKELERRVFEMIVAEKIITSHKHK